MIEKPRNNIVRATIVSVAAMTLCGGCAPIGGSELETFVGDLLRNAAAALLF